MVSNQRLFGMDRRGREGSYPPSPRTDPGVRNYRTGLLRDTHFRTTAPISLLLFPTFVFALLPRPYMSGQGFLCRLRISVSPFPT